MSDKTEPQVIKFARRRRRVAVSLQTFAELMTTGWKGDGVECVNGLPVGALIISTGYDPVYDWYYFIVEHESFEPVPEGAAIPLMHVTYAWRPMRTTTFTITNELVK